MPPDEDHNEKHGIESLCLKYGEFKSQLELDEMTHRQSEFYLRRALDGILDKFVNELNDYLEPIRETMNSVDRFSIMFMGIGFFGTIFVAGLIGLIVHVLYSFAIIALFVLVLGCVLLNNNKKLNYTR